MDTTQLTVYSGKLIKDMMNANMSPADIMFVGMMLHNMALSNATIHTSNEVNKYR